MEKIKTIQIVDNEGNILFQGTEIEYHQYVMCEIEMEVGITDIQTGIL
jgi:hypothetical protein